MRTRGSRRPIEVLRIFDARCEASSLRFMQLCAIQQCLEISSSSSHSGWQHLCGELAGAACRWELSSRHCQHKIRAAWPRTPGQRAAAWHRESVAAAAAASCEPRLNPAVCCPLPLFPTIPAGVRASLAGPSPPASSPRRPAGRRLPRRRRRRQRKRSRPAAAARAAVEAASQGSCRPRPSSSSSSSRRQMRSGSGWLRSGLAETLVGLAAMRRRPRRPSSLLQRAAGSRRQQGLRSGSETATLAQGARSSGSGRRGTRAATQLQAATK